MSYQCSQCKKNTEFGEEIKIVRPFCSLTCRDNYHGVYIMGKKQDIGYMTSSSSQHPQSIPHILEIININEASLDGDEENEDTLTVLYTDEHLQFAIETVPVEGFIEKEIHLTQTQFIRIEEGEARIDIFYPEGDGKTLYKSYKLSPNGCIIIHASTYHKVTNIGFNILKFSTVYAPHVH